LGIISEVLILKPHSPVSVKAHKGQRLSEFNPSGLISTIHDLYEILDPEDYLANLEKRLSHHARSVGIGLILPCLMDEARNTSVIGKILDELGSVDYLRVILVALGGARKVADLLFARELFTEALEGNTELRFMWADSPAIRAICDEIGEGYGLQMPDGKGRAVWLAMGYMLAREDCQVIAVHDTDILTYDRILLGRLIEPTADREMGYDFCKGFYARICHSEMTLKGRVTRLFVIPFVEAMYRRYHDLKHRQLTRFFHFFRSFRYPLAGEWSISREVAQGLRLTPDWTLEVKVLAELHHMLDPGRMVQVDLARNYDHKHQPINGGHLRGGLKGMVVEISKFFLHSIINGDAYLDDRSVREIQGIYRDTAMAFVERYWRDSFFNSLSYDFHGEVSMVEHFSEALWIGWEHLKESDLQLPEDLPSWGDLFNDCGKLRERIIRAVEDHMDMPPCQDVTSSLKRDSHR
jgi:glucosyl-3-phosphoglycerate synthase